MATQIDIPGSDQSVDLTDPLGSLKGLVMAMVGFLLAIIAGSAASYVYNNFVAPQSESLKQVNLD